MNLNEFPNALLEEMTGWRRHLHAHPETAFEEHETADFVATKLQSFGIEVHGGIAGTGVVGVLRNGDGPMIGLRADMDALHVEERTDLPYRSQNDGKMHACGHDGHTAMLLGAAKVLAGRRNFEGTLVFIFQPAEENEGGARVMIEQGLFERFPVEQVFGLHNWPSLPAGRMAVRSGPMMAAFDRFELQVNGHGAHAAMPHLGADPIVAASHIVTGLQTIASRVSDPLKACVLSVTQIHAGDAWNVIPDRVVLRGTTRWLDPELGSELEQSIWRISEATAKAHGCSLELDYRHCYPPTINSSQSARICGDIMTELIGADKVDRNPLPSMGAEDFAFMLQQKPGCYAWLGTGTSADCPKLHNPYYDFNDAQMPLGVAYWTRIAETFLKGRNS